MPTTPPQIDPEETRTEPDASSLSPSHPEAPVSVVPHEPNSAVIAAPVRIRTNRYGDMEEHELIRLLDTIDDERARGRFRESIYISTFVCLALAWVALYGPRYLWHAPELISPVDVMKHQELIALNNPVLPHPVVPAPKLDKSTIAKIKEMTPKPASAPPAPPAPSTPPPPAAVTPPPPSPTAPAPISSVPTPLPRSTAPPVADAPLPEAPQRPNFKTPATASDAMKDLLRNTPRSGSGEGMTSIPTGHGAMAGGGAQVLSDTQGVDFSKWLGHFDRDVVRNWYPLLPEETEPPLNKRGDTYLIVTILPDGKIGDMRLEGSSHDVAIDKSAWGAIVSEGQFEALPREFHGPNLVLRCHFVVSNQ
jgi:hypothetical protein